MAKHDFTASGGLLVITLDVEGGLYLPQIVSIVNPSIVRNLDRLSIFEMGLYKTSVLSGEIGFIDGVEPTDFDDAYDKLIALIAIASPGVPVLTANLVAEISRATTAEASKEALVNKSIDVTTDGASDTKYPSVKAVKTYVDSKSVSNTTTTALSLSALNLVYPDATLGFHVYADLISTGALIYIKTASGWISQTATIVS